MSKAKGNLVVGQSGGPTAVINNSLVGVVQEAMKHPEIGNIMGMAHGIAGILNEEFVDMRQESSRTLELLRDTPASALGTVRYKVSEEDYERILEVFIKYDVRYFFYIGGNDSMDTCYKMSQLAADRNYELHAIGVPKTVDNDLAETDHCPGYGSAARFVASAVRNTAYDTRAMGDSSPIKLVEVMGRNAGWLTAATVLAKENSDDAPHLIYLPEQGKSIESVVADVEKWYKKLGHCVIAVSEGFKNEKGEGFSASTELDAFGHARLGGVVEALESAISEKLGLKTRYDKPGYLQRSFGEIQSPVDREEAYNVGCEAVKAAIAGNTGVMISLDREPGAEYICRTGLAPLSKVANAEHMLPREWINAEGNGVTESFVEYARPLIGGPLKPYSRLSMKLMPRKA